MWVCMGIINFISQHFFSHQHHLSLHLGGFIISMGWLLVLALGHWPVVNLIICNHHCDAGENVSATVESVPSSVQHHDTQQ